MRYYLKKLGSQELGSVKNGKAQRGRYIYISKDSDVLDFFPQLSKTVVNDSAVLPIIPLYGDSRLKIYCNYIYHNDKFSTSSGTRDEYRIYSNSSLENNKLLFETGDILIFRAEEKKNTDEDSEESWGYENNAKMYFLYLCCPQDDLYSFCSKVIDDSTIRGGGHAIYDGQIKKVEEKIAQIYGEDAESIDAVIDDTVTAKAQDGDVDSMANLFNSISFRDFVMNGYEYKCAITRNVIRYGTFMNLEAAHIQPRSHQGLYLPSNGIAMCRDMHWAFDKGMFTIDDGLCVRVHPDISSEYLKQYDKKQIFVPKNSFFAPDVNNLHYHQKNVYGLFKVAGSLVKAEGYIGNNGSNRLVEYAKGLKQK
ncbi:HNH endonuclease [Butyrivibrio sp. CB08]|uniref:HNH endonuclease n=1 Tax=Butyrivibrio sp. CB08 TaxID=2364879 RepID=UPI000EA9C054|nr:HNH endonuclease signature motif containing protein [Butyrivibrio sp. CB08]RKM55445.1 HNH endonuclease [Butyrivibrio sp. CB08]